MITVKAKLIDIIKEQTVINNKNNVIFCIDECVFVNVLNRVINLDVERVKFNISINKNVDCDINGTTISLLPIRHTSSFAYVVMNYADFIKNINKLNATDGKFFVFPNTNLVTIITDNKTIINAVEGYHKEQSKLRIIENAFMDRKHDNSFLDSVNAKQIKYHNPQRDTFIIKIENDNCVVLDSHLLRLTTGQDFICKVFFIKEQENLDKFAEVFNTKLKADENFFIVDRISDGSGFIVKLYVYDIKTRQKQGEIL